MPRIKFQTFTSNGKTRFRIVDKQDGTIATGTKAYEKKSECKKAIKLIRDYAATGRTEDLT